MAQKTVGYVELEWTCSRCGTRNPGLAKSCKGCGAPMEEAQQFDLPPEQQLIADEAKLETATKGPDIHCGFCGARNPAGAERCSQCGASLGEGRARQAGQVLGAFEAGAGQGAEIPCPFCGTPNPASAVKCMKCGGSLGNVEKPAPPPAAPAKKGGLLALAAIAVVACIGVILLLTLGGRTTDTVGVVQGVSWERIVPIMAQQAVERQAWADEIPAGATRGGCTDRVRSVQDEPAEGAKEVCGTPYTIDQGSGVGKVVQDCRYEIYDQWCTYRVQEWQVVDRAILSGTDLNPQWPAGFLQAGQREGDARQERYVVTFRVEDESKTLQYSVPSAQEFARFTPGSRWTLRVNSFGNVTGVEPAR